jgi:membrane-associated protease RseP (regulator of RpoE activity)
LSSAESAAAESSGPLNESKMNAELIAAIIFFLILTIFAYINRKRLIVQKILFPVFYFLMLRTKLGLKAMDRLSKHTMAILRGCGVILLLILVKFTYTFALDFSKNTFLTNFLYFSGIFIAFCLIVYLFIKPVEGMIAVGFAGMVFIVYSLIQNSISILTSPTAIAGVGVVLPFQVKGAFYVPFFYWLLSIFIIAVVHEGFHGVLTRFWGLKLKSSGLAALAIIIPVIPLAFVEPDEKQLSKRKMKDQLSIFAAGPFSNIALGFLFFGALLLIAQPITDSVLMDNGVKVTGLIDAPKGMAAYPAKAAGITANEVIQRVDSIPITTVENFTQALEYKKPYENVTIATNLRTYHITLAPNAQNASKSYIGIQITQSTKVPDSLHARFFFLPEVVIWLLGLVYWLFLLNLGIGMFNLLPLGPVDGGRMLDVVLKKYFSKEMASKIFVAISVFFLLLILINAGLPFFRP